MSYLVLIARLMLAVQKVRNAGLEYLVLMRSYLKRVVLASMSLIFSLLLSNGMNVIIVRAATLTTNITASADLKSDGTGGFDGTTFSPPSTNPGTDSTANNGVVRTNDTIVYAVHVAVNNKETSNIRIFGTAPSSLAFAALPSYCITDSTIATPVSAVATDQQSIVCNLGNLTQGVNKLVDIALIARPNAGNNTTAAPSFQVLADSGNTYNLTVPTVLITSTPKIDVEVDKISESLYTTDPTTATGNVGAFIVYLKIPKGGEPMNTGTYNVNLSITNNRPSNNAKLYTWDASNPECEQLNPDVVESFVYGKQGINSRSTVFNSVKDSGTITCSQGAPGGNVSLSIANPDSSLANVPIKYANTLSTLPGSSYFAAAQVKIWFPDSDIPASPSNTISINLIQNLASNPTSISGGTPVDTDSSNDTKSIAYTFYAVGSSGAANNFYSHSTDANVKTPTVLQGDKKFFGSRIEYRKSTSWVGNADYILCRKVDSNLGYLTSYEQTYAEHKNGDSVYVYEVDMLRGNRDFDFIDANTPYNVKNIDPNTPVSNYNFYSSYGNTNNQAYINNQTNVVKEYSTAANNVPNIRDATCEDADGPWSTTPPSDETTITKIRYKYHFTDDFNASEWGGNDARSPARRIQTTTQLGIKNTAAVGSRVGIFDSVKVTNSDGVVVGWVHPNTSELDPNQAGYALGGGPHPSAPANIANDVYSDSGTYAIVASAKIAPLVSTEFNTRIYENGKNYRFSAGAELGMKTPASSAVNPVTLVVSMDPGLKYMGTEEFIAGNTQGMTKVVTGDSIAGTTITYTFPNVPSDGSNMPLFWVDTYMENVQYWWPSFKVEAQSPLDTTSTQAERTIGIYTAPATQDLFSVSKEVSYGGNRAFYNYVDPAQLPTPTLTEYLNYTNGGTNDVTKHDLINILPLPNNTAIDPESHYNGTVSFNNITGLTGGSDTLLVTKAAAGTINEDPCHISNIPVGQTASASAPYNSCKYLVDGSGARSITAPGTGSLTGSGAGAGTTWCVVTGDPSLDASYSGLGANCPLSRSEIVAVRVVSNRTISAYSSTQSYVLSFNPSSPLTNNDVFSSHYTARILENNELIRSNDVAHTIKKAETNGYAYYDFNNNFMQDTNEGGMPNAGVNITGTGYGPDGALGGGDDVAVNANTTANNTGYYEFTGLYPGAYTFNFTPPAPKNTLAVSDIDGILSPNTGNIALMTGQVSPNNNFGYEGTNDLSGFVYEDFNRNNVKDGTEQYIVGALIEVLDQDNANAFVASQLTADQNAVNNQTVYGAGVDGNLQQQDVPIGASAISLGQYFFNNLPTGNYLLRLTTPSGYTFLNSLVGSGGGSTNGTALTGVVLGTNQSLVNYNFTLINSLAGGGPISTVTNAVGNLANTGRGQVILTLIAGVAITITSIKLRKRRQVAYSSRRK